MDSQSRYHFRSIIGIMIASPTPDPPRRPDTPDVLDAREDPSDRPDQRQRIVRATAALLDQGGREAVTTRAVSAAAGVQPPAIYRQFGDMRGLLDAAARETLAAYVRRKTADAEPAARGPAADDPVEALRRGWDLHVAFGLAHPAAYALAYGDSGAAAAAREGEGEALLRALVARIAAAGRLRVDVPHAVRLVAAAATGATLALVAAPPGARDPRLSAALREAVLAAITAAPASDAPPDVAPGAAREAGRVASRAVALRAVLAESNAGTPDGAPDGAPRALSPAERDLLGEWLDRLAGADA
ncbi:TetR family transcriptional regulator [Gemmatimonadetes bacterium T265]|nr:TetR family transcriptional regulator [Gemmatimonadetes bacterium T265]